MNIVLNNDECQYLIDENLIDKQILDMSSNPRSNNFVYKVDLTEEYIDHLREQLEDKLQIMGFDENYELTEKGKVIEKLIDKLYID